jgi:hypothetical protein
MSPPCGTQPLPPPPLTSLLSSHRATIDDHAALWLSNLFVSSPLLAMTAAGDVTMTTSIINHCFFRVIPIRFLQIS